VPPPVVLARDRVELTADLIEVPKAPGLFSYRFFWEDDSFYPLARRYDAPKNLQNESIKFPTPSVEAEFLVLPEDNGGKAASGIAVKVPNVVKAGESFKVEVVLDGEAALLVPQAVQTEPDKNKKGKSQRPTRRCEAGVWCVAASGDKFAGLAEETNLLPRGKKVRVVLQMRLGKPGVYRLFCGVTRMERSGWKQNFSFRVAGPVEVKVVSGSAKK